MARPAVGSQVSHYRLERVLGAGGMGEVFLARDLTLDRPVAIKFLIEPDDEQVQLLSALLAAADERGLRPFDDDWLAEIQRRSAEFDAGLVTPIPWAEAKEWARQEVARRG